MRITVFRFNSASLAVLIGLALFVVAGPAASTQPHDNPQICSATASLQLSACYAETTDDYFPLVVGNHWVYEEDGEKIDIEIQDATKRVAGFDCIIYRDIVTEDELLVESTDDWFALRTNGDVTYCGE